MVKHLDDMELLDKYAAYKLKYHMSDIGDYNTIATTSEFRDWLLKCSAMLMGLEKGEKWFAYASTNSDRVTLYRVT